MNRLRCPLKIVESTLDSLRAAGVGGTERGVYWLAGRGDPQKVVEVYVPLQEATRVLFWISPHAMKTFMSHLRQYRLMAVAQVHSHPGVAFHSTTDDRCSLLGHAGALSVVVPFFAKKVTPTTFVAKCSYFCLSDSGSWVAASRSTVRENLQIERS
jgi:hypothetical protein